MQFRFQDPFDVFWFDNDCKLFQVPFYDDLQEFNTFEPEVEISQPTNVSSEILDPLPKEILGVSLDDYESESAKTAQSDLHNCPKHLIKFIIESLDFPNCEIVNSDEFSSIGEPVKECLKGLLGIIENCAKGKIKSLSKELLKIVFEEGAEHITKLKLLQNTHIKKVFQGANSFQMNEAKAILRQIMIAKLLKGKTQFVDKSRIVRKGVNERYLQMFVQELKNGKVKERVSKQDKEWILQSKNF